jgi:hypothetical protein
MKRITSLFFILLLACAVIVAQEKAKEEKSEKKAASKERETTVKGEVVDVACYLRHGEKGMGEDHKACGEACAKNGGSLGILTKDGKLYVSVLPDDHSTSPNAALMEHIAHQVEATGLVRSKGGVRGIMISKVAMVSAPEPAK